MMTEDEALIEAQRRWGKFDKPIYGYSDDEDEMDKAREGYCRERNGPNTYKDGKREFVVGVWKLYRDCEEGSASGWIDIIEYKCGIGDSWESAFADADRRAIAGEKPKP